MNTDIPLLSPLPAGQVTRRPLPFPSLFFLQVLCCVTLLCSTYHWWCKSDNNRQSSQALVVIATAAADLTESLGP